MSASAIVTGRFCGREFNEWGSFNGQDGRQIDAGAYVMAYVATDDGEVCPVVARTSSMGIDEFESTREAFDSFTFGDRIVVIVGERRKKKDAYPVQSVPCAASAFSLADSPLASLVPGKK